MNYRVFNKSRQGVRHIQNNLPCQDSSASEIYQGVCIVVVADGHGSRKHFRSDRGSGIACKVALETIHGYIDGDFQTSDIDEELTRLKGTICQRWCAAVRQDLENNPWSQEELDDCKQLFSLDQYKALCDGTEVLIAYGSTLCAAFATETGWAAIQLGDGCFVYVSQNGVYEWPMPDSHINEGNLTASLCMQDPMYDFRHCWGTDIPAGLFVMTDGIEKTFPPEGEKLAGIIHRIRENECRDDQEKDNDLVMMLDLISKHNRAGDDVSIAGIIDQSAKDVLPSLGKSQRKQELKRLKAQIEEIENTISFNEQRLSKAEENDDDLFSGAVNRIKYTILQKKIVLKELMENERILCEELEEKHFAAEQPQDKKNMPVFFKTAAVVDTAADMEDLCTSQDYATDEQETETIAEKKAVGEQSDYYEEPHSEGLSLEQMLNTRRKKK